jgi:oligoribonuclease NrnB/cAMP/cGMP phosphodiesterase (DHH superfamily)
VDCAMGAKEFLDAGHKVVVLDHHEGIEDVLDTLAQENSMLTYVFDNDKSGASIAWSHFFPGEPMPEIIKYVEDVDIWNWKYGDDSKHVNNYLFMLINKPEEVAPLFDKPLEGIKKEGSAISRYRDFIIDLATKNCEPVTVAVGGRNVPFYNITESKSESGNILSKERGTAVALFSIDGGEVKISFRSLEEHVPSALDLAKTIGGGGHRNAAGAAMKLEEFIKAIRN